jgi:hypothetical protein
VRRAIHPLLATNLGQVVPTTTLRLFADEVADACDDANLLRQTHRQRLLKRAAGLGIRRFDANLIIAAVQHRRGASRPASPPESTDSPHRLGAVASFALVQAALVAGACWLLFWA